jgi:molecular chaperone GrpE
VADLRDRLLRLAAEFDNWKKRASGELADAEERGRTATLLAFLPALDNAERALKHMTEADPIAKGVRLVYRQLLEGAEKLGVRRFESVGEPFDPRMHHAIADLSTSEMPPGIVAQVHVPGYLYGDKVIRPAVVTVSKRPTDDSFSD